MKATLQRAVIREVMKEAKDHPDAEAVYRRVSSRLSGVGVATVYRNLRQMAEEGELRRIARCGRSDCFDGALEPHAHMVCKQCGALIDVYDPALLSAIESAAQSQGFLVGTEGMTVSGICARCSQEKLEPQKR